MTDRSGKAQIRRESVVKEEGELWMINIRDRTINKRHQRSSDTEFAVVGALSR